MNNTEALRGWRSERNMTSPNYPVYIKNKLEEMLEPIYDKEFIPNIVKTIYSEYFERCESMELNVDEIVDSIVDSSVFDINEIELMGYDYDLVLNQTIQEISSRNQCPIQYLEWEEKGAYGKWKKDTNQKPETLYKANFNLARR